MTLITPDGEEIVLYAATAAFLLGPGGRALLERKAVRESETSANPSTLPAEIESHKTPLNAESDPSTTKTPKP